VLWLLSAILLVAVGFDLRERRVPNWLIALALPLGWIATAVVSGMTGLGDALLASVAAIVIFLPFFALRMVGAGDVKLASVVGAYVGTPAIFKILLFTVFAGGVLGLVTVLVSGQLRQFYDNLRLFVLALLIKAQREVIPIDEVAARSAVRMPYSVAMAAGVFAWWVFAR